MKRNYQHAITTKKKTGLLWQYFCNGFKNRLYMSYITEFFGIAAVHRVYCGAFRTAAIGIVFCSVLQWRDIKPLQYIYICFSDGN